MRTVTDDARFTTRDFFVRRRYRDFVWLRGQLVQAFPGAIVPPLPPADKPGELPSAKPGVAAGATVGTVQVRLRLTPGSDDNAVATGSAPVASLMAWPFTGMREGWTD